MQLLYLEDFDLLPFRQNNSSKETNNTFASKEYKQEYYKNSLLPRLLWA